MNREHEPYEALMMAAVDGVLDDAQHRQWQQHLAGCVTCQSEFEDFQHIKEVTDAMTVRIQRHASIEPPRPGALSRSWLAGSMLLIVTGGLLLLAFGGYALWQDPSVPLWSKAAWALMGSGTLGLFLYALRARWRAASRDPYQEIDQ